MGRLFFFRMYKNFIKPLWADVKIFVLDALFPKHCLSCETEGEFICLDCKACLKTLEFQRCIVCQKSALFGQTHPKCLTPQGADGLISFFNYHDEKVAQILIKGKYSFLPEVYQILGAIIANKIKKDHPYLLEALPTGQAGSSYKLVPIPLHSRRRRWRGFNQAEILCLSLSDHLSLPCTNVLVRCKSTAVQKNLKRDDRVKNIRDAFALSDNLSAKGGFAFGGQSSNFILVDDVATTGTTLLEAAKVLKRNGATKVFCLTVARD